MLYDHTIEYERLLLAVTMTKYAYILYLLMLVLSAVGPNLVVYTIEILPKATQTANAVYAPADRHRSIIPTATIESLDTYTWQLMVVSPMLS